MNICIESLGVALPTLRARDAVLQHNGGAAAKKRTQGKQDGNYRQMLTSRRSLRNDHHSCLQLPTYSSTRSSMSKSVDVSCVSQALSMDDDDTASTMSSTDVSLSSGHCYVAFADPPVTQVYERPVTTIEEKQMLYYSDLDFREFRRDVAQSKRNRRSVVQFISAEVSHVFEYSRPVNAQEMYYSESDLHRFLEEFVSSLEKK